MTAVVFAHRLLVAALSGAALLGACVGAAPALAQSSPQIQIETASGTFEVTARINFRQLPSSQSKRLGVLNIGEKVQLTGKVANSQWAAVLRGDGVAGFVLSDALRPAEPIAAPDPVAPAAPPPTNTAATTAAENDVSAALAQRLSAVEEQLAKLSAQNDATRKADTARDDALQAVIKEQQALAAMVETLRAELAEPQSLRPLNDRISALTTRLETALTQASADMGAAQEAAAKQIATAQIAMQEAAAQQIATAREAMAAMAAAVPPDQREAMEQAIAQAMAALRAEMANLSNGSQQTAQALNERIEALSAELRLYQEQQADGLWPRVSALGAGVWQGAAALWTKAASPWW